MNPFKVLGASPTDSRQRLQALLQDAALLGKQEEAENAYALLIRPDTRLEAELAWYPEKETGADRALWRLNRLLEKEKKDPSSAMMKACEYWGEQSADDLLAAINADHEQGGWKTVQYAELREAVKVYLNETAARLDELYQYDAAVEERVSRLSRIKAAEIRQKGQKQLITRYANALLAVIGRYQRGAQAFAGNELVEALVSRYELRFAGQTEELRENILRITSQRKQNGMFSWRPGDLLRDLQDWSTLTMPVRKLIYARGMHSASSEALADEVRLFMAELFNRFNDSLNAKQLIQKLRKCFPEYEWLQKQLKEDEAVIRNGEKRKKFEAQEKREKAFMPFGILMIVLAIIVNRCSPEEPDPIKQRVNVPLPSEDTLKLARIYLTNNSLREKREAIEAKEEEIQRAFALGGKVDIEALNAELTKLKTEYAALKLGAEQLLKEIEND